MPIIVVTRLRLKDPAFLNDFFNAAASSLERQVRSLCGFSYSAARRSWAARPMGLRPLRTADRLGLAFVWPG